MAGAGDVDSRRRQVRTIGFYRHLEVCGETVGLETHVGLFGHQFHIDAECLVGQGGLALQFETTAVVFWSVLLLSLGVLSSLVAARRVLRIDPIEATTGQGVGS